MTKKELILKVSQQAKINNIQAKKVVNSVLKTIKESLKQGESITLAGLGTFKVKATNPRQGRNPKTGETIEIPASKRVLFKISSGLKKAIKSS